MSNSLCQNPLQCAVVHQVKAEMTQMNSKLGEINFAIRSIFQVLNGLSLNPVTSEITSQYSVIPTYDIVQENDEIITNENVKEEPIEGGQYYFGHEDTISGENINQTERNDDNNSNSVKEELGEIEQEMAELAEIEQEMAEIEPGQGSSTELKAMAPKPSSSYTSTPYQFSYAARRKKFNQKEPIKGKKLKSIYCVSCQISVYRSSWLRHVAAKHFSQPALTCGVCGYTVPWRLETMTRHCRLKHPNMPWNINDRRDQLKWQIQKASKELLDMVAGNEPVRRDINVTSSDNGLNC